MNEINKSLEGTIKDKDEMISKRDDKIKELETQVMVADKKVTEAKNDFDELSNAVQYHSCSNKNCEFLK